MGDTGTGDTRGAGDAGYRRAYAIARTLGDGRWSALPIIPHRHAYGAGADGTGDPLTMQELVDAIATALDMDDAPGFLDDPAATPEGPGFRYATGDDEQTDDTDLPSDGSGPRPEDAARRGATPPSPRTFDSIDGMMDAYRSVIIINEERDDVIGLTDDAAGLGVHGATHRTYPNR